MIPEIQPLDRKEFNFHYLAEKFLLSGQKFFAPSSPENFTKLFFSEKEFPQKSSSGQVEYLFSASPIVLWVIVRK